MKWGPHNYQKEAIRFMVQHACAGLLLDPGLGKTSITYATFKLLRNARMVRTMLVIAPLRPAHSVWPAEARKWEEFEDLKVVVLHGPDKDKKLKQDADVHVINPEGLGWLARSMGKRTWDMLVVDESTRFKHTNTQRFKTLKPLLPQFRRRYILTGSPAPNGLLDLFGQVFVLDLGHALGQYITHYRMKYFDNPDHMGWNWRPREGAEQQIYERLKPLVLRMDANELLDLPPLLYNTVRLTLPDEAMAIYKEMEKALLTEVEQNLVVAGNAAAATTKCRQIASGGIYTDQQATKWSHIHKAKVEAVQEIVEELQGKPALIAYEFKHDLERLQAVFPDAPHIGGGVSTKRFREIEQAWNRGDLPVLLAQPQSVAHGINLQGTGAAVIWHSLTWDLEVHEQFIRRVWRQGQREKVIVHYLIASDTVDVAILQALHRKDRTQQTLLGALKDYAAAKGANEPAPLRRARGRGR